jgi:hypothetical protein
MANATDFFENRLIDQWFRGQAITVPGTLYAGLFKADPGESGSIAQEVAGGSYARVAIVSNGTNWTAGADAGSAKRTSNGVAITFPSPTADWGTVSHWGLLDAATLGTGNIIVYGALSAARTILTGDNPPSFAIGSLTIDFS